MKIYEDGLIVITGAAGFIGSGVVRHLNDKGISNLVIVDNLGTTEKWKNLIGKSFADIISTHQLFGWLEGKESTIKAIIHLGACSSTVENDASFLLENNYHFSVRLAEYALDNNIRFLYASSAATYGDGSQGFSDDHDILEKLVPLNMYGYSKQLFDLWLKKREVLDKVVGLKYFNVYGPNEYYKKRMASIIMHILPMAQKEGVIRLFKSPDPAKFADGNQCRDAIYVKEAVRMTCAFLDNTAGGIFNIGTGRPKTWNEIAKAVFKAIDKPTNIEYIDVPEDLIGKYQYYTNADMSKTARILGKDAICDSLENNVVEYVKNYLLPQERW